MQSYNVTTGGAWPAAAVLPNISVAAAIEGDGIALVPPNDERIAAGHPNIIRFLDRFTDAFGSRHKPASLVVSPEVPKLTRDIDCIASFRDILVASVIPYSRAERELGSKRHEVCYSDYFEIYPWMLGENPEVLVANTPALLSIYNIEAFNGQSSPSLSVPDLNELDELLFEALVPRWRAHFLNNDHNWNNLALFRSLNMAQQAAGLPAGRAITFHDIGRMLGLWVSAFEILVHPGGGGTAGFKQVYQLLDQGQYATEELTTKSWSAYPSKKTVQDDSLLCRIYGELYRMRNDFMHGNPIDLQLITPPDGKPSLFWIAPLLYRCALAAFLQLRVPEFPETADFSGFRRIFRGTTIERAIAKLA